MHGERSFREKNGISSKGHTRRIVMPKPAAVVREVFKGLARTHSTSSLAIGPVRATGVPAILVGVCGIVLASGVAAVLSRAAGRLPETLREANGLAQTIRGERPRLTS
jgi:hypothetical protein